jgi:predicted transglutaminase-like cysteine proteinase
MRVFGSRRRNLLRLAFCAVALLVVSCASGPVQASGPVRASFFESLEVRLTDLHRFAKWQTALERSAAERLAVADQPCSEAGSLACRYREWQQLLDGLRGLGRWQQLDAVNRFINEHPYRSDASNWSVPDHWATLGEFLTRSGDCEDYAIAKFLSLKDLGWSDAELRLVAVKDSKLGVGHAVLVVFLDDRTWVLDNQTDAVLATDAVGHYRPVYSINESAWWLHRHAGRA